MLNKSRISPHQFRVLVILYSIGSTIIVVPAAMTAEARQEAWLPALLGIGVGTLFVWLYLAVGNLYPDKTLVELNEKVFGKWLGKGISLLVFLSALLFSSEVLFYLGSFLTTQVMPETSILAIHIAFMIIVTVGVRTGIETLARCGEILFPWFIIPFIIFDFSSG